MALNNLGANAILDAENLIKQYVANKNLSQTTENECCNFVRQILTSVSASEKDKASLISCLQSLGTDIETRDKNGDTAFLRAAWENQCGVMQLLKLLGADVNAKDTYDNSALMLLATKKDVPKETIELLASLGTDFNAKSKYGKTALMLAIEKGMLDSVKLLIKHSDIHIKNNYQEDVLTIAKNNNQTSIYQFLFEILHPEETAKLALEKSQKEFQELLSASTLSKKEIERLNFLITQGGIDPNMRLGPDKVPALIFALRENNIRAAELLIKLGADKQSLNEKHTPGNQSILHSIVIHSSALNMLSTEYELSDTERAVIYFLCDNGVDLNVGVLKNDEETSPLDSAKRLRNTPFIKVLNEYFLNKNTTFQTSKKTDTARIIKEAGHILGFTAVIEHTRSNGFDDFESFPLLRDCITNYTHHNPSSLLAKHFNADDSQIKEALDLAIQWQEADGTIRHQHFLEHYEAGKITILPVSAARHSFTLIACNDILIVCNRGGEQLDEPISLFKIPDPGKITKEFLKSVIPENRKPILTDAVGKIKEFLDIKNNLPLMTFPSHEQKHGTCTFVNIKAALQPLLFLCELHAISPLSVENGQELDSAFLQSNKNMIQLAEDFETIAKEALQAYKAFTEDMRNQKVNELCAAFQGSNSSEDKALYLEIFKAIIKEHHGQRLATRDNRKRTSKMDNEKRRAEQLLNVLSPNDKHALLVELLTNSLNNPKASPKTIEWLKTQDSTETHKENVTFTPLLMHVNPPTEKIETTRKSNPMHKPP